MFVSSKCKILFCLRRKLIYFTSFLLTIFLSLFFSFHFPWHTNIHKHVEHKPCFCRQMSWEREANVPFHLKQNIHTHTHTECSVSGQGSVPVQECGGMISCGGVGGETRAVTARHLKTLHPASSCSPPFLFCTSFNVFARLSVRYLHLRLSSWHWWFSDLSTFTFSPKDHFHFFLSFLVCFCFSTKMSWIIFK